MSSENDNTEDRRAVASVDNLLEWMNTVLMDKMALPIGHRIRFHGESDYVEGMTEIGKIVTAEVERLRAVHAASYAAVGRSLDDERAERRKRQAEALAAMESRIAASHSDERQHTELQVDARPLVDEPPC